MKKQILSCIFLLALLTIVSGVTAEANYCCEKTTNGAWCQNAPQEQCDPSYQSAPTSCESTSYCKLGCCFDSREGLCMESTPQRVCEASNGTWANNKECNIIQCQLGCCVLADQGAFVTLTRCKQISGFFGLKTDFRKTITNELSCIAAASSGDKGACVTDNSVGGKTCKFTTRDNCKGSSLVLDSNSTKTNNSAAPGFYKDVLCTAPELGTDCGKSTNTTLISGKDEVYFTDTCGNIANIYDGNKFDDPKYWRNVYKKSESCGAGSSNAGSKTCGNCDYYLGSIGKKATGVLGRPTYGNYICVDLSCKSQGKKHGESWCVTDSPVGKGLDTVGSRYYKEVCLNNEILTEPCADYRNEICIEGKFGSFTEAACRVNRWQDCIQQEEESDCENRDVRECMWISGYYFSSNSAQIEKSTNDTNNDGNLDDPSPTGLCIANYPPGFNFWGSSTTTTASGAKVGNGTTPTFGANTSSFGTGYVNPSGAGTSASAMCSLGNAALTVKWEKKKKPLAFWETEESWQCTENCQYAKSDTMTDAEMKAWAKDMNEICYKLGDCGGYINFVGKYTDDGYAAYYNNKRVAGSGGAEIIESKKTTTTGTGTTGSGQSSATTPTFTNPSPTGAVIKDWIRKLTN